MIPALCATGGPQIRPALHVRELLAEFSVLGEGGAPAGAGDLFLEGGALAVGGAELVLESDDEELRGLQVSVSSAALGIGEGAGMARYEFCSQAEEGFVGFG